MYQLYVAREYATTSHELCNPSSCLIRGIIWNVFKMLSNLPSRDPEYIICYLRNIIIMYVTAVMYKALALALAQPSAVVAQAELLDEEDSASV